MVCIEEGRELGRVGSLLIDPDEIRLVGFTLSVPDARSPVKVVPVEAISSFGTFALTISKSDAIADLAGNEYYLSLFEKDIVLLGTEVRDTSDKLIGFVKDAHMDPATGALLRFRITSDKGFLSPYNATVPVSVIRAVEKDRLVIHQDHVVAYQKESHLATSGEERRSFVPLVAQTDDLKDTIREHIDTEMEKIRKELHDYLFQQHEEYFVSRERKPLEQAVTETVRRDFDTRIHDTVTNALLDYAKSLPALVPQEIFDTQIKQLRETIEQAAEQIKTEAASRTHETATQAAAFIQKQNQAGAELEQTLKTLLSTRLEQAAEQTQHHLEALKQQIHAATDPLAENMARLEKDIAARMEQAEANTGDRTAEASARVERLHSVFKDEIAVLRTEIEERIHAALDRVNRSLDATRQDQTDLSDSVQTLVSEMESGLKQRLDKQISDKMAALENSITRKLKQDETHAAAFDSRLSEQNAIAEKAMQRAAALEKQVAALNNRLQDALNALETRLITTTEQEHTANQSLETRLNSLETNQNTSLAELNTQIAVAVDEARSDSSAMACRLEALEAAQEQMHNVLEERTAAIANDIARQHDQAMKSVDTRIASLEDNWQMADAAMSDKEQAAKATTRELEALGQKLKTLAAAMPDADALRAEIEERLDPALQDFDFLKNALGTMQQVQESVLDRETREREALAEQVQALTLQYDESARTLEAMRGTMGALRETVSEQNARDVGMAGALEERIDQLQDGFDELRGNGLHALQRLASVETTLNQAQEQLASAASREELNAVTDSLARIQELGREIDALQSLVANQDTREAVNLLQTELATLRDLVAQSDQERDQTRLAALDRVRADMNERIQNMHLEISELLKQSSEETAAHADSEIVKVRQAIESLNLSVESHAGLSEDQVEALIHGKLDSALAQFMEQLAPAVSRDDMQELDTRFRELLKDKLDALRDLLLGALDGRIDELKSQDEAARIENMIDDSVQKSLDALQGQIQLALEASGAAAPRSELDVVADMARRAVDLSTQQKTDFDAAVEELDARFQNLEESLSAQQTPGDTLAELRDRLAELETTVPEATGLAHRLESLQSAADSVSDAETRLTRKVKDVQESTEILSDKINALLGKNEFDEEKQEILQLLDDKTARLETGLGQLHERLALLGAQEPTRAEVDPDQFTDQLERQFASAEKRLCAKSDKAMERALAHIQDQMKSLADELADDTRQQADEAISAVNAFQARFMSVSNDIDRIEALLATLDASPESATADSAAIKQHIAALGDRLAAVEQSGSVSREIANRLESLEKEMSWAAHTVQELATSPIMSVEQTLDRQERVLKDLAARLDGLEIQDKTPVDPNGALQKDLDDIAERFADLENRPAAMPDVFQMRLDALEAQFEEIKNHVAKTAIPAHAPAPDVQAAHSGIEDLAQSHFEQLCARMDQAVDQKIATIEQRLDTIQKDLEKLHAIKDDIFQSAVEPNAPMQKSLDEMAGKLHRYEELMEEESEVVNRLLDEVQSAQALMTRTRETTASHEQLQALSARIQDVQAGMERVVMEISSRTGSTELVDQVHRDILDTLRKKGLRELIFPARDLFAEDDAFQNEELPPEITESEAVSIFGDRLTRNILGGRVLKDILTDDERCIIHEGDIVDNEMIGRAKQHGKFLELTLNVDSDSV